MLHVHVVILCTVKTTTTAWSLFIVLGSLYFSVSGDSPLQFCHLVCHNLSFSSCVITCLLWLMFSSSSVFLARLIYLCLTKHTPKKQQQQHIVTCLFPFQVFRSKVLELGEKLLPAFSTPTGIPRGVINLGRWASAAALYLCSSNSA